MEIKDRIKKIRSHAGLTQQVFADKLGIKRNTVATYETGKGNPSDSAIVLICREFGINEQWLRTGQGEMSKPEPNNELDILAEKYKLTNRDYIFIEKLLKDSKVRNAMEDFCIEFASAVLSDTKSDNSTTSLYDSQNAATNEETEPYESSLAERVAEAEAEYIKSRSKPAKKTEQYASTFIENTANSENNTEKAVNQ